MAVRLSAESAITTNNLLAASSSRSYSLLEAYITEEDDDDDDECSDRDDLPNENTEAVAIAETTTIQSLHEYELSQSESLTFLHNLLFDDSSNLSKGDILKILNALKIREDNLPFSIKSDTTTDTQGIRWPRRLREKFYHDRSRVGKDNWFHSIPGSRERAIKNLSILDYCVKTDFFQFHRFFSKLKLHITHLQLRNLVCCGSNTGNGIYYPSSYFHDSNLQAVNLNSGDDDCHAFFKINRIMPDKKMGYTTSEAMKVDCLIDSRTLGRNSNSKISTLECTDNYLVSGTFEGSYILTDVSDPDNVRHLGEHQVTNHIDGITNHVIINEKNQELIVSSNDRKMRIIDMVSNKCKNTRESEFAVNCAALNPNNANEIFITGDSTSCYVVDTRENVKDKQLSFSSHYDYGFGCDWSPSNENLLLSGNQDSTVKLWDRRKPRQALQSWSGALGFGDSSTAGPVRNCKFSYSGDYISWAESLDHVGIIETGSLLTNRSDVQSRIQKIDFVGKCAGLRFTPSEQGNGEQLIIGVIDCPLGGILSYKLESKYKSLDYDFEF